MDSLAGNRRALGISYYMMGMIFYAINKKDSALLSLKKSIPISKSIRNLPNMIKTHELMAKIYEEKNQLITINVSLKKSKRIQRQFFNLEEHGQISRNRFPVYELPQRKNNTVS